MKYIVNGNIILKDRIMENSAIGFEGKICEIIDSKQIPEGVELIDAKGGFVAPGLVDIHIHGYLGEDTSDGSAEGIDGTLDEAQNRAKALRYAAAAVAGAAQLALTSVLGRTSFTTAKRSATR